MTTLTSVDVSHCGRRDDLPVDYVAVLAAAKAAVQAARTRVALAANSELILLYWKLGKLIGAQIDAEGWGTKVVDRLSADLRHEFPEMSGFSPRNLRYMRSMATAWPDEAIVQQVAAKLPWAHLHVLLDRLADQALRDWYAGQAIANGWSRNVLVQQIVKDPYNFEFLTLASGASEREVEADLEPIAAEALAEVADKAASSSDLPGQ